MRVFKFAVILLMAALVFLAGCMTTPQDSVPQTWSATVQTNTPVLPATNTLHVATTPVFIKTNPGNQAGLVTVGKGVTPPM